MERAGRFFAGFAVLVFVGGCMAEQEEVAVDAAPVIAFEGDVDERFVGSWSVAGRKARYEMKADGTFTMEGEVSQGGNVIQTRNSGEWLVGEERLRFRGADGAVSSFRFKARGTGYVLTAGETSKNETVWEKVTE